MGDLPFQANRTILRSQDAPIATYGAVCAGKSEGMSPASQRMQLPEALDLCSPVVGKAIALRGVAIILHAPITEGKLVLSVHERRRCAAVHAADAARAKDAVMDDLPVFVRAHCVPDFASQLFANDASFPNAASPQCKAG